jgi:hypothetical protein
LPELHLKNSNTHNFLSIGPKDTNFILPQSLLRGASLQKVFKNPKFIALIRAYPKTAKAKIWPLRTSGIKVLGVFFINLPQNSTYSKHGGLCKLGVFFSTSNH